MTRPEPAWRKSSYSDATGTGDCVEVAVASMAVAVRDTKSRTTGMLTFTAAAWGHFLAKVPPAR
ncbi:MAG: hypothetical protein QOI21_3389 [Actinomycetota bacterium]|nr:hypothetical protein [Actinomycetota bacterium]